MQEMELLGSNWTAIQAYFVDLGFHRVELDPRGYRRGALLAVATQAPD
jgi:PP-loop superfamily ATP-utilizing enzyme